MSMSKRTSEAQQEERDLGRPVDVIIARFTVLDAGSHTSLAH
jgi:hypothetical protein